MTDNYPNVYEHNLLSHLADLGLTIDQYNLLNLTFAQRQVLDLRLGLNGNSPMTFTDIAKIRNVTPVAVRAMFIRTCDKIFQRQYAIERAKYKPIEDNLFKICLFIYHHQQMPFISYQTH
jgi:DNA-directed RNA polymerase sigma subunit (sigma70/sigma32)